MDQDFRLSYVPRSWVGKCADRVMRSHEEIQRITFANSTSFAYHDIADILHNLRTNQSLKAAYRSGTITLDTLNAARGRMGYPAMSATYTRKVTLRRRPKA